MGLEGKVGSPFKGSLGCSSVDCSSVQEHAKGSAFALEAGSCGMGNEGK